MSIEIEKEKSEVIDKSPVLLKDLGMRFPTEKSKQRYRFGLYKCGYCGKEWETQIASIKDRGTKSCGCQHNNSTLKLSKHRIYMTWYNMIQRCYNPSHIRYDDWGGRGITVCDEWKDSPAQFIKDMFPSFVEGLTLDRIDNDKGYSKENCRWATKSEQCTNQRISVRNTSGFIGVSYRKHRLKFTCNLSVNNKNTYIGLYDTALEAAIARNNYIIENNLLNKLNIIPEEEIK